MRQYVLTAAQGFDGVRRTDSGRRPVLEAKPDTFGRVITLEPATPEERTELYAWVQRFCFKVPGKSAREARKDHRKPSPSVRQLCAKIRRSNLALQTHAAENDHARCIKAFESRIRKAEEATLRDLATWWGVPTIGAMEDS